MSWNYVDQWDKYNAILVPWKKEAETSMLGYSGDQSWMPDITALGDKLWKSLWKHGADYVGFALQDKTISKYLKGYDPQYSYVISANRLQDPAEKNKWFDMAQNAIGSDKLSKMNMPHVNQQPTPGRFKTHNKEWLEMEMDMMSRYYAKNKADTEYGEDYDFVLDNKDLPQNKPLPLKEDDPDEIEVKPGKEEFQLETDEKKNINSQIKPPNIKDKDKGEFEKEPKKQKVETTTTTQKMEIDPQPQSFSSGASTAIGHHGSYFGHGDKNKGYEKWRLERDVIKTKNRKDIVKWWPLSEHVTHYDEGMAPASMKPLTSTLFPGLRSGMLAANHGWTANDYNGSNSISVCNQVVAHPFNFIVQDFIDPLHLRKLGGRMREWKKVSLISIHVEIEIHTRIGNYLDQDLMIARLGPLTGGPEDGPSTEIMRRRQDNNLHSWAPSYLFFRDVDGDYSTDMSNIPPNVEFSSSASGTPNPPRHLQYVKQLDKNINIVKDNYSFTRKIQAGGPYFLTPEKVWELRKTNIAALINEIESQGADASGNLNKWPEYFNLLCAPTNSDMFWFELRNRWSGVCTNFHTEFHIRTSGTWACYDREQSVPLQLSTPALSISKNIKSDPYYDANVRLNKEIADLFK